MIVRFNEFTRYDIQRDCEVVRFMGVTNDGTYSYEAPVVGSRQLRETRNAFKDRVISLMQSGLPPAEIDLA